MQHLMKTTSKIQREEKKGAEGKTRSYEMRNYKITAQLTMTFNIFFTSSSSFVRVYVLFSPSYLCIRGRLLLVDWDD